VLRAAGFAPAAVDTAVDPLPDEAVAAAGLVAVAVPMHTALRLGVAVAERVRRANPAAHVCFYGLYATLNAEHLLGTEARRTENDDLRRSSEFESVPPSVSSSTPRLLDSSTRAVADSVVSGELEPALLALAEALDRGEPAETATGIGTARRPAPPVLDPLPDGVRGLQPDRRGLPGPRAYARLEREGTAVLAGAIEATRGCHHTCRHCPIPPIYGGRFFVVPRAAVVADGRAQVAAGARHLTFTDPDFFNGPGHGLRIMRELRAEFPWLSFDATIKVEHLLQHRAKLPELAGLGCAFVVTAVESLSDRVLERLDKGHTRAEVEEALALLDAVGVPMRPSLLPFTPVGDAGRVRGAAALGGRARPGRLRRPGHALDPAAGAARFLPPGGVGDGVLAGRAGRRQLHLPLGAPGSADGRPPAPGGGDRRARGRGWRAGGGDLRPDLGHGPRGGRTPDNAGAHPARAAAAGAALDGKLVLLSGTDPGAVGSGPLDGVVTVGSLPWAPSLPPCLLVLARGTRAIPRHSGTVKRSAPGEVAVMGRTRSNRSRFRARPVGPYPLIDPSSIEERRAEGCGLSPDPPPPPEYPPLLAIQRGDGRGTPGANVRARAHPRPRRPRRRPDQAAGGHPHGPARPRQGPGDRPGGERGGDTGPSSKKGDGPGAERGDWRRDKPVHSGPTRHGNQGSEGKHGKRSGSDSNAS
jgi:hypothetical protein